MEGNVVKVTRENLEKIGRRYGANREFMEKFYREYSNSELKEVVCTSSAMPSADYYLGDKLVMELTASYSSCGTMCMCDFDGYIPPRARFYVCGDGFVRTCYGNGSEDIRWEKGREPKKGLMKVVPWFQKNILSKIASQQHTL